MTSSAGQPDRHQARILAMQALCQYDVQGDSVEFALLRLADEAGLVGATIDYARALCEHFVLSKSSIDTAIERTLGDRALRHLDDVVRSVIRVATVELVRKEVPPKVAVDEAIEIAREFGGADSPPFVNGVLDTIMRKVERGDVV